MPPTRRPADRPLYPFLVDAGGRYGGAIETPHSLRSIAVEPFSPVLPEHSSPLAPESGLRSHAMLEKKSGGTFQAIAGLMAMVTAPTAHVFLNPRP
ncbi:hypothetical protein TNCT6_76380 [Streptomyces sp. 6-11-2]|nr:hypothetical protein TNCT6_76380 [Streptomyces sp. 6-11-2]